MGAPLRYATFSKFPRLGGRPAATVSERRGCGHHAPVDLEAVRAEHGDDFPVSAFIARSRCSRCGAKHPEVVIRVSPATNPHVIGPRQTTGEPDQTRARGDPAESPPRPRLAAPLAVLADANAHPPGSADWDTSRLPPERRAYLELGLSYEQIVKQLVEGAKVKPGWIER